MLITKEVEVFLGARSKEYYRELGYEIFEVPNKIGGMSVPMGTKIKVKVEDLPKGSKADIEVLCDYCLESGIETKVIKKYWNYLKSREIIQKDCCTKCQAKKVKESMLEKYNVENYAYTEEFNEKRKQTCLNKYGVEHYSSTDEFKNKFEKTMIEKYGVSTNLLDEETINQIKNTNMNKYGTENPMQNKSISNKAKNTMNNKSKDEKCKIVEKRKKTNLKKYGTESPMQVKSIAYKSRVRANYSLYKNNSMSCSRQQKYLYNLIGGELNYPINHLSLDIAFPEENVYIEYDGSGHDLRVAFGECTIEEFKEKELKRHYYLKNRGWKRIRIVSVQDYLPTDEVLLKIIKEAKKYLNSNHSWIEFNIDDNMIKCSQYEKHYNYGKLRKIKKEDLNESKQVV